MSTGRKTLPHEPPAFVDISQEVFFITICAATREDAPLLPVAEDILKSLRFYQEQHRWELLLAMVVPDHLHFLIRPSDQMSLQQLIARWRGWTVKHLGIQWQRDFFDHRLRNDESIKEKWHYILRNPERAGLVADWRDWPFVWTSNDFDRFNR